MSKKSKIPHTFTIVFVLICLCAVLTWIIPGGEYSRETITVDGQNRQVVDVHSFKTIEKQPQTWQIFTAFFKGFEKTSYIIVFILMVGGAFWIFNTTKAIDVGITQFLKQTDKLYKYKLFRKIGVDKIIIVSIILVFSLFGAIFGMSEETIAFMTIFVPFAISLGYDSIVGVLICYAAAHVGFAGAIFNPFTLGIAQGLSGLPLFSGLEYRIFCWAILTLIFIIFTLIYAGRVKRNPEKSIMYELDDEWRARIDKDVDSTNEKSSWVAWSIWVAIVLSLSYFSFQHPFTTLKIGLNEFNICLLPIITIGYLILGFFALRKSVHNFILSILLLTVIILVVGVLGYQWYIMEIAGLFFAMGISTGFAYKMKLDKIMRLFLDGCKDIMVAAMVVGLAGGIMVMLEDGKIIDTILHEISQAMSGSGKEGALTVMYLIQNGLNILIPSGSAKAALTIPMMAEFSDIVGLSRQVTVLAFQFGDGFTNMITPTSGVLIGCLGIARVPYVKWMKFIFPFIIVLIILGFLLLLPAIYLPLHGF
ncbi:MAG TPA: AbgT family transporter [Bacteroidales bacterium]|nr:AbgT family transporter [Bacteroidales bacterium]HRT13304.1 AbgT family transporter [Bacteroidales bacterium]HXK73695.1 AbgT family transporter [Bacteroidales bacterium]